MISNEIDDICMRWDYEALAKRYRAFNKFEVEREERRAKGEIILEEDENENEFESIYNTSNRNVHRGSL